MANDDSGPPSSAAETGRDWFGNPLPPPKGHGVRPVPCPMCGVEHSTRAGLEAHLSSDHAIAVGAPRRARVLGPRVHRWIDGLRFLPLWFVLPVNVLATGLLVAWAGGFGGFVLFAEGDQLPVVKTWLARLSLLPTILVLAWRTVDRRV